MVAKEDKPLFKIGDYVEVKQTSWIGQIIDWRVHGYNDPEYLLRLTVNNTLAKEWFSLCELDRLKPPTQSQAVDGENVINVDFTKRAKRAPENKGVREYGKV